MFFSHFSLWNWRFFLQIGRVSSQNSQFFTKCLGFYTKYSVFHMKYSVFHMAYSGFHTKSSGFHTKYSVFYIKFAFLSRFFHKERLFFIQNGWFLHKTVDFIPKNSWFSIKNRRFSNETFQIDGYNQCLITKAYEIPAANFSAPKKSKRNFSWNILV